MAERTLAELQHILGDDMDPNSLAAIGRRIGVVLPREDPDLWSQAMTHNLTQALREAAARRPWPDDAAENAAPSGPRAPWEPNYRALSDYAPGFSDVVARHEARMAASQRNTANSCWALPCPASALRVWAA